MNYNYLRYFSVLAQLEHYTLAAARLEISQPSLSSAIRNLEDELGVQLFEKVGRNIRLTDQGRYFQKKVDAALQELTTATHVLQSGHEKAPVVVRLGIVSGALRGFAAKKIASFIQQKDRAVFKLTEESSGVLMDLVRQEKLDMAIVSVAAGDRSLRFRKLLEQELVAVVPEGHPLTNYEAVDYSELFAYTRIHVDDMPTNLYEMWADGSMPEGGVGAFVNTAQAAVELVAAGAGIAVIPLSEKVMYEGIAYVPVRNRNQELYLCTLKDRWLEPTVWNFAQHLLDTPGKG